MSENTTGKHWFVMRDLRRRSAKVLAIHELADAGFEVFTPMSEMLLNVNGKKIRRLLPVIQDLLFVHSVKEDLDRFVEVKPNLQYRYSHGRSVNEPTIVRHDEMERFIKAVSSSDAPRYYMPGEITPSMYGRRVRIVGGPLDNYEGCLLSVRGMRTRRLIVEISGLVSASVEVNPDFIQFV